MLEEFIGQLVVLDLRGPFVCLGLLKRIDGEALELNNADFHDLRDSQTDRENYVAACRGSGIKRNRKRVLIMRSEVVALSGFNDIVDM